MSLVQPNLFGEGPDLPDGMTYAEEVITPAEEKGLAHYVVALPLKPFEFVGGLKGNRKVISFGWRYDFGQHKLHQAEEIPTPLLSLRQQAATVVGIEARRLQQVLVTEYAPGAGIGWQPAAVRSGDRRFATRALPLSLAAEGRLNLGAQILHRPAALGLLAFRRVAPWLGT